MTRGAAFVLLATGAALLLGSGGARAQNRGAGGSVIAVPEGPPVSVAPDTAVPSDALPAPDLPSTAMPPSGPTVQPPRLSGGTPRGTQPGSPAAQLKPQWDKRNVAVLDMLDKADGAVTRVTAPVGSSFTAGLLRIAIDACVVRPPDMAPDAAVYMIVNATGGAAGTPPHDKGKSGGAPLFRGWLIRSEPGATVVGDAAVTFRLIGCKSK